jgi:serine/threonine-protein kinase
MTTARYTAFPLGLCLLFAAPAAHGQTGGDVDLARQALGVFQKFCYRCHGQNGAREGNMDYILDPKKLADRRKLVPGNAAKSRILRLVREGDMPPEGEKPRPGKAEMDILEKWIQAGAAPPIEVAKGRTFISTAAMLRAIRDHVRKQDADARPFLRFYTLTHLHNLPSVKDDDLRLYRAALSKLVNSLSWKKKIVLPQRVDPGGTIFAVDLRDLDWDRYGLWKVVLEKYPYGLSFHNYPEDEEARELARELTDLTGTALAYIRADWFIAHASRPPLYHLLLRLPASAGELERLLDVNVEANYLRGALARAGFANSGVSGHNRLVERHEASTGAYWKSYDFKSDEGEANLILRPLGPLFRGQHFPDLAFRHAGGEIIFNLPNGLQGYLLVDGKDRRIDEGPIEVVSDRLKTSGTPAIVNGLSCMACHKHGMIADFKDSIRSGTAVQGEALSRVKALYKTGQEMDRLLKQDEDRFLAALDQACGPFLRSGPDDKTDIRAFSETIGPIARWYNLQKVGAEEAAAELGLENAQKLKGAIETNARLRELGLGPLAQGETIGRQAWESLQFFTSPFQETARIMRLGTPLRVE